MTVKRQGKQWVVTNKNGTKVLGRHSSKAKALRQLRAVEANKRRKG